MNKRLWTIFTKRREQANKNAQELARDEFDGFVRNLRAKGVRVEVLDDTLVPHTPDSIFPNNWISMHDDGRIVLYQ